MINESAFITTCSNNQAATSNHQATSTTMPPPTTRPPPTIIKANITNAFVVVGGGVGVGEAMVVRAGEEAIVVVAGGEAVVAGVREAMAVEVLAVLVHGPHHRHHQYVSVKVYVTNNVSMSFSFLYYRNCTSIAITFTDHLCS